MQTLANSTTLHKAPKAFFAHLDETSGVLSKINQELVFFGDDDMITVVEPEMISFLVVLGEVGLANCQQLMDRMNGGAAAIACSRAH